MDVAHRDPHRVGGWCAVAIGVSYVAITGLYVVGGALPQDPSERLRHIADHTVNWWTILTLSVVTDLLLLPVMWSLYRVLRWVDAGGMLAGTGLVALFVVLDLAVTWPNYAVLIGLSDSFVAADEAQRPALLGAATYAAEVLSSRLFGVYAILVPAVGIGLIGFVMLRARFGGITASLGIATGVLGAVSVFGALVVETLGTAAILTSVLTLVWLFLVGYKLLRPAGGHA